MGELEDEWPVTSGVTPVFEDFDAASGACHVLLDAFYLDEPNTALAKSNHPIKSFFNRFTRYDSADPKYETASVLSAFKNFINPLRDSWAALTLLQTFDELLNQVPKRNRPPAAGIAETKQHFEAEQGYFIFVPPRLRQRYAAAGAGPKREPRSHGRLYMDQRGAAKGCISWLSAGKGICLVKRFSLLGKDGKDDEGLIHFRHRDFVQEICKGCLLP